MADEKEKTAANAKSTKDAKSTKKSGKDKKDAKSKKPNIFVRMGRAIKRFTKDFKGEMKKITWPDAKTVFKGAGVVIAAVIIIGIPIWLADFGLAELLKLLEQLSEKVTANAGIITLFSGLL